MQASRALRKLHHIMKKRYELCLGSFCLGWSGWAEVVKIGQTLFEGRETLSESRDMQYKQSLEVLVFAR